MIFYKGIRMQAIIKFNLDEPRYKRRHEITLQAEKYLSALTDIREFLLHIDKYSEYSTPFSAFNDKFYEILDDNDIDLDKL